jgi:predicted transcriptional regulator YheO
MIPEKLKPYVHLVDFLADFLGEDTEVVLHDVSNWHRSVIAIRNGHISGRKIGAPVTDFILNLIKDDAWRDETYRVNYKGAAQSGNTLRSATYFIKDEGDGDEPEKLIGLLCINMDCQKYIEVRDVLDTLIPRPHRAEDDSEPEEIMTLDVSDLVIGNIKREYDGNIADLRKLRRQEKVELVGKLQERGTFMVKGTIWEVAELLGVSVPTIYRYIATIKKEQEIQ